MKATAPSHNGTSSHACCTATGPSGDGLAVITRTTTGLRLKHDHRHEDGTADKVTHYGGDTATVGTAIQQDFPADEFTAELIPAAKTNVWSFLFSPKKSLSYRLVRASEGRRFRVAFDLTKPIPAPPAPWGHR